MLVFQSIDMIRVYGWDGSIFEVGLTEDATAAQLRKALAEASRIPFEDQILLLYNLEDKSSPLDSRKSLRTYGLPADDKQVFLYDRRLLASDAHCPPVGTAYTPPRMEDGHSATEEIQQLSRSTNPLLNALATYGERYIA